MKEKNERRIDATTRIALHALSCPHCIKKVGQLHYQLSPVERYEILSQIELHEMRVQGRTLHS